MSQELPGELTQDGGEKMWMVRAGEGGYLASEFLEQSVVALGWSELGDLSRFSNKSLLLDAYMKAWPTAPPGRAMNSVSQLLRFRDELLLGDMVTTYDSGTRTYHIGKIQSGYQFTPEMVEGYPNVRVVGWHEQVDRDVLSVPTRNTLGSTLTLFQVSQDARAELLKELRSGPWPEVPAAPQAIPIQAEEVQKEEESLETYRARAFEITKDRLSRLGWDEMQELVAGLLRAMGYKTRVAKRGPDRGTDILASPDGFGFEQPRITVEVKHRNSTVTASEIRSFVGARHPGDKGLYVSTGGFTKDARYEADRASITLMLLDLDELVKAIFRNYEQMDIDAQKLLPLKKIYWPV